MPTQPLNTAAIEARLAAATPGPWRHTNSGQSIHPESDPEFDGLLICEMPQAETEEEDARNIRNFELLAHAPADLRALLDEVGRLRLELATYTDEARRSESGEWRCERCDEWQPMCATNAGIECDMCVECAEECRAIEITP